MAYIGREAIATNHLAKSAFVNFAIIFCFYYLGYL